MPSRPIIETVGDIYKFDFQEEKVRAQVAYLRDTPDGLKGELQLATYREGEESFIHYANMNLLSTRSRKEISKYAGSRVNTIDWDALLECVSSWTVQYYREGEPVKMVGNITDEKAIEYTVYPIVIKNEQNIIYGYGGTGKSYIACLLAMLIQTGSSRVGLNPAQGNVLYLDYETSSKEINRRIRELKKGLGFFENCEICYRKCHIPIADDIETIKQIVLENRIDVLIVDSVGPACGGEPETADVALRYFRALRSLGITIISITHRTKKEDSKGPFGSIYWWNFTRNIWKVKLGEQLEQQKLLLSIHHEKSNLSGLFKPIGLEFAFFPDAKSVLVNRVTPSEAPELNKNLPPLEQVKQLLLQRGMMTEKAIYSELHTESNPITKSNINKLLTRHAKDNRYGLKELFIKQGNSWGVLKSE